MRAFARMMALLVVAGACVSAPAAAQPPAAEARPAHEVSPSVKAQALERFRVLVLRDGIVLTPRRGADKTIEISRQSIAVNGAPVSGRELDEELGTDAELVLQLSYASPDALRAAFAPPPAPTSPAAPSTPAAPERDETPQAATAPEPAAPPASPEPDREWRRKSGAKINVGGDVQVEEDERVTDAVVAVFGDVDVRGRVEDDVVAVLGNVRLGPHAVITGSVTSVGGRIEQERGAEIRGEVNEVRLNPGPWHEAGHTWQPWHGRSIFSGWFSLLGTLLRIALLTLLAVIVAIVASGPTDRITRKVAADPWVSGFVGLLAQVLFVPVLVLTVVVLGIAVITAGAVVTRIVWLIPGPIAPLAIVLSIIAVFLEYVAWTVGLGALLLTRFGTRGPSAPPLDAVPPPVPPPLPADA